MPAPSVRVEHQATENPPALVQLRWVMPCQVKGNTQGSPGWVRHPPAEGEAAEAAEGEGEGEAGFWQEFFFTFLHRKNLC